VLRDPVDADDDLSDNAAYDWQTAIIDYFARAAHYPKNQHNRHFQRPEKMPGFCLGYLAQ
jgi:hypothetical protein